MKHYTQDEKRHYLTIALTLIILAILIGIVGTATINAQDDTPSDTQYWQLLNDNDQAYLLTQPGCNLIEQELGEDARLFTLECDPVKDGE